MANIERVTEDELRGLLRGAEKALDQLIVKRAQSTQRDTRQEAPESPKEALARVVLH